MRKKSVFIINLLLFIFVLIYFTQISPLVPFDVDDWRYIGGIRPPFPLWGVWNPTRVLPETLMGVGGYIASFVIYPFTHDYINSLTFVEAVIFSVFIMGACIAYYRLLVKRLHFNRFSAIASELLFFISFFLLFKHLNQPSYSGFWTVDLSCVFFYLIPGLLNASVMMYMEGTSDFSKTYKAMSNLDKGIFILTLYFTLFSNTQLTIIIATYSFFKIIQAFLENQRKIDISYFKAVFVYLLILFIWLCSIIFDLNGQRAKDVQGQNNTSLFIAMHDTLEQSKVLFQAFNVRILVAFICVSVLAIIAGTKTSKGIARKSFMNLWIISTLCLISSFMYLFIAYTKAGSMYASRPDAMWPIIFFLLFISNLSFAFLITVIDSIQPLLPLVIVLASLVAFNLNYRQVQPTNAPYSAVTAKRVDNYIIKQIKHADEKGESEVMVKVPVDQKNYSSKVTTSNWPHSYDMAVWLQNTLYSHGIIRTRMHIVFKPDKAVNARFYENKNEQSFAPLE